MALSNSTNYTTSRDAIITRALRIVNEIGTGETPNSTRISECALVLNDIFKEWEALGMQLWKITTFPIALSANTGSYTIGIGSTISVTAPTKILQCYSRNTTTNTDSPLIPITKQEYDLYNVKSVNSSITQWYYNPPGPISGTEQQGTIYFINRPDANEAASHTVYATGVLPFMDFDSATDTPDIPSYLFNALVWALAEQLSYESGVPLSERAMISKQADKHLGRAMSFDIEEGSLYIQPSWLSYRLEENP